VFFVVKLCDLYLSCYSASNSPHELKRLEMPYAAGGSVETICLDFGDQKKYESLVLGADVVIRSISFIHI